MTKPFLTESSTKGSLLSTIYLDFSWSDLWFWFSCSLLNLFDIFLFFLVQNEFCFFLIFYFINNLSSLWNCWKTNNLNCIARNTDLKWISSIILELFNFSISWSKYNKSSRFKNTLLDNHCNSVQSLRVFMSLEYNSFNCTIENSFQVFSLF